MMKSYSVLAFLCLLWLGCSLDVPRPEPKPDPIGQNYVVKSEGDTVWKWYDGNGTLLWIDRYVLGTDANPIKKYHYSALDKLLWYEYARFEKIGGSWVKTREQRFLPPKDNGTLVESRSWAYDADRGQVLANLFNENDELSSFEHFWTEKVGDVSRLLQQGEFDAAGLATKYELYRYDSDSAQTGSATLRGDRSVVQAWSQQYEDGNVVELQTYRSDSSGWERASTAYLPDTDTPYRLTNYTAPAEAGTTPEAPGFDSAPPAARAVATSSESTSAVVDQNPDDGNDDPIDPEAAIAALPEVQLVAFPTLNEPTGTDWTMREFYYYLPGPNGGKITIHFNADGVPTSLLRAAEGAQDALDDILVNFEWDFRGFLTKRTVFYGGNSVLSVSLTRDGTGRIARIDTAGSLLRVPLSYTLAYTGTAQRPEKVTVSSTAGNGAVDIMTLRFTYESEETGAGRFGLGALSFDSGIESVEAAVGGGNHDLDYIVKLDFLPLDETGGISTKTAKIMNLISGFQVGRLVWTIDDSGHQTAFVWEQSVDNGGTFINPASYSYSWGEWAELADGLTNPVLETLDQFTDRASEAVALADSFDLERFLQVFVSKTVLSADSQTALKQATAYGLLDQVKAAVGN